MFHIRELREAKGINMKEAARLLDMPYTTYVNYEKGLREPTSEVLIQIADFYGTTIDYLVGRDTTNPFVARGASDAPSLIPFPEKLLSSDSITHSEDRLSTENYNIIKLAGRDGSFRERRLSDQQMEALTLILDQMPDVPEDL